MWDADVYPRIWSYGKWAHILVRLNLARDRDIIKTWDKYGIFPDVLFQIGEGADHDHQIEIEKVIRQSDAYSDELFCVARCCDFCHVLHKHYLSCRKVRKILFKGEVVNVDNLHHMRMLTLRSDEISTVSSDKLNIFLNHNARVIYAMSAKGRKT